MKSFFFSLIVMTCFALFSCKATFVKSDSWLRNRAVKLTGNGHSCSGEQIIAPSGKTYVLTAGHCLSLKVDGKIHAITEDKKELDLKVIAEDPTSDLLLLQGLPKREGLIIAKGVTLHQHVRTFTHGFGFDTYKTEGEVFQVQEIEVGLGPIGSEEAGACNQSKNGMVMSMWGEVICTLKVKEMATTAFIVPGSSGGMVLDDKGDLVGVVSAGGQGFGFLVTLSDIQHFLKHR